MTKKPLHSYDDFDDDEWEDDEFNPLDDAPMGLSEEDIRGICGQANAARGKALFVSGAVTQRSFDGEAIHATVNDNATLLPVVFDLMDADNSCSDVNHARRQNPNCEHIAALLYAFSDAPKSFFPQTIGEFINAVQQHPALREQLGAADEKTRAILETLQRAPPEVRTVLEQLSLHATPAELARVAPQLQMLAQTHAQTELAALLELLSLEQLRAIAQRRGWGVDATTKAAIITQLAAQLKAAPLPAEFSPEEEQLLRLLNTLEGLAHVIDRGWLERLWKKRAGGDLRRLDLAVQGLQTAGLLFPCRHNGKPHYHWSPCVGAEDLPLLEPKLKPYPAEKIERMRIAEPAPLLPSLVDAVCALAEHEPLRVRAKPRDPKMINSPYIGAWDYEPAEANQLIQQRLFSNALTIPLASFWADETLELLETFAHGSRELGAFVAGLTFALGMLQDAGDGRAVVVPEKINAWCGLPLEEKYTTLWTTWRAGAVGYSELRMAAARASLGIQRSIHARDFTPPTLIQEIALARQFVTRLLTPLEPLTWYSWKAFAEFTRDLRPDFLHTFTNQDTWFFLAVKTHHRYQAHNTAHWDAAYRPVLAALLEGALRWLGVVEVAHENNELVAFQITPLGAWLLSGGKVSHTMPSRAPTEIPSGAPISWLDETTCRLRPSPEIARVIPLVRAFADPTREMLTFRVSNTTLARAFERGITSNDIAAPFAQMGAPLPNALRERIAALYANFGRAHLYERLTVLELADDFALRELLAGTSLAQSIVHQFSPRVIVVRDEDVDALVAEMVKKGYMPRIVTNDAEQKAKDE